MIEEDFTAFWSLATVVGCPIGGEQVIAAYISSSAEA